jgi:hypothetical protein
LQQLLATGENRPGLFWLLLPKTDRMSNIVELFAADFFEAFA